MKILWIHSHFFHWMGGTIFVFEIVKKLSNYCYVEILVQNGDPIVLKKFTDEGIIVNNLNSLSTNSFLFWLTFNKNCAIDAEKIQKIIYINNFDTVITSMFPANYIVTKLRDINFYQYCYEPYAAFWDSVHINNLSFFKRYISYILRYKFGGHDVSAVNSAKKVFTLSPETKRAISIMYNVESVVTYLGVDIDFYKYKKDETIFNKYKNNIVLLHSTDFSPPKGTDFLLDCMSEIIKKVPTVMLLITCTKKDCKKIKNLEDNLRERGIASHVTILGFVKYELLPCYYSVANLVVYSGTSNGGGASAVSLFVLEAMACGTPCLRSNDSKTEVLDHINGELFNPLDHNEFITKCSSLLVDNNRLNSYSNKCREYIGKKYSWVSTSESVFNNIMNQ
jgi:glycosyltransferase involved in cell wall biosynthesis